MTAKRGRLAQRLASTSGLEACRQRVAVEAPHELRRHPEATRHVWLAVYADLRGRAVIDTLVVDFLLTAKRDLEAAKRFFRKPLQDQPLLSPDRIGTDGAGAYPPAIAAARKDGLLARTPAHYVTKHLQQGIESDHFQVKRPMPRVGCFQAFHTARRTIQGFEAMLWLRKGFGFAGAWTVREQNRLLALCFGLPEAHDRPGRGRHRERHLKAGVHHPLRRGHEATNGGGGESLCGHDTSPC